jgi:hypothetical protein
LNDWKGSGRAIVLTVLMERFDAAFTVDSVVTCCCGDFPFKAIFYPEHLNEIAIEPAQQVRQVLF